MVLQALNEEKYTPRIADEELEEFTEILYKIKDPKYSRISKQDLEDMVDSVMNREIARAEKKKKANPAPKKPISRKDFVEIPKTPLTPKSGGMNFGNLEKIDSDSEANGPGFKD